MDALRFIHGYQIAHHGVSPTRQEIADALGIGKTSAWRLVTRLEKRGLLRTLPNRDRAIEVLHPPAIPRSPDGEPLFFVSIEQPEEKTHG
jgi:SOS-response transcriptional repressor LexA